MISSLPPVGNPTPLPAFAVAYYYRERMSPEVRAAVATLLAFQANPTSDLEPIFAAVDRVRRFWKATARAFVVDTRSGAILDSVSAVDEENDPGRYLYLSAEDQAPAVLGHSLGWIFE